MVGCYIAPRESSTLENVVAAIGHRPIGVDLPIAGNFNADLESPDGNKHDKTIASVMATEGLEYMTAHFLPHKLLWMQDDRKNFQYPMYNTDHYMVLGCLHVVNLREHRRYLGSLTRISLYTPKHPSHEDKLFASLRQAVTKTTTHKHAHTSWILEDTWWFIDTRVSLRRSADRC